MKTLQILFPLLGLALTGCGNFRNLAKDLKMLDEGYHVAGTIENAADTALDIIEKGGASGIFHAINEDDLQKIIRHPATMIGSDGEVPIFGQANPHPRSYGTFVRVLGRYVRELKVISLEEAIRKMTSLPASILGLADRGTIKEGQWADLVIFDPATVADKATFEDPFQYPVGIDTVLVNGTVVLDEGTHTNARPGKVLRRATPVAGTQ